MADVVALKPSAQTPPPRRTGAILQLVKTSNKDTIEALGWLLCEAGNLSGITVTFRRQDGSEEAISTGVYKARPELALRAALRFSAVLAQGNE